MSISQIVTILSSGGLSLVLMWLVRTWISERLKSSIKYEYDEKLKGIELSHNEKLKSLEHEYSKQLERLKVELKDESAQNNAKILAELEHDRNIFNKLMAIVDEITFRDACETIRSYSYYDTERYDKIRNFERYAKDTENRFLNVELQEKLTTLVQSLAEFTTLVGRSYFHTGGTRYMIYPELKHHGPDSEERKQYEKALGETRVAGDNVLDAYDKFRLKVKKVLFV